MYPVASAPPCRFYWGVSMASLILYFVTSSDSGSLVIDCLTANGNPHPPVIQRVFWSVTEGAVANALLKAGGTNGLQALQAVSIIAGLPYSVVVASMCYCVWVALSEDYDAKHGIARAIKNKWAVGLIDVIDYPTSSFKQFGSLVAAIFVPFNFSGVANGWLARRSPLPYIVFGGVLFYGWILLLCMNIVQPGLYVIGWLLYLAYAIWLGTTRNAVREARVRSRLLWHASFPHACLRVRPLRCTPPPPPPAEISSLHAWVSCHAAGHPCSDYTPTPAPWLTVDFRLLAYPSGCSVPQRL